MGIAAGACVVVVRTEHTYTANPHALLLPLVRLELATNA